jgi:hypothetical protein
VNVNDPDPLTSREAESASLRAGHEVESVGSAPDDSDEQVGKAPGGDESVGHAPATGGRNVPVLVGGIVAVVVLLAVIIGVFAR